MDNALVQGLADTDKNQDQSRKPDQSFKASSRFHMRVGVEGLRAELVATIECGSSYVSTHCYAYGY